MVVSPTVLSLTGGSLLIGLSMLAASSVGVRIIGRWDLASGSAGQLALERMTYLVSTLMACVMVFELAGLFLYVYTGEALHSLFVGSMCAAGTFNVNDYGYPTLVLKLVNAILGGIWLVLNHVDNQAHDYPLIRQKYILLLPLTGLVLLEGLLQLGFFRALSPSLITSCCGTLFSYSARTVTGSLAAMPPAAMQVAFFLSLVLAVRVGLGFLRSGRGAVLFGALSAWLLLVAIAAVISFISVFYYELPTHHCPFCLIQAEYRFVGYPLFVAIIGGTISGGSVGVLERFRDIPSLQEALPRVQRTLCRAAMGCFVLLAALAAYPMLFSRFTLSTF